MGLVQYGAQFEAQYQGLQCGQCRRLLLLTEHYELRSRQDSRLLADCRRQLEAMTESHRRSQIAYRQTRNAVANCSRQLDEARQSTASAMDAARNLLRQRDAARQDLQFSLERDAAVAAELRAHIRQLEGRLMEAEQDRRSAQEQLAVALSDPRNLDLGESLNRRAYLESQLRQSREG